jgi:integrase
MPTLYRRAQSPYWWLYYVTGGRKVRASTGIRHDGRRTPPPVALEIRRVTEERLARSKFNLVELVEPCSLDTFWNQLLHSYSGHSERSQAKYGTVIKHFSRWAKDNGVATVADLTGAKAIQYVDASRKTDYTGTARKGKLGAGSLRSYVMFLKQAWDEARKRNYTQFTDNPWKIRIKVNKVEKIPFTQAQITSLLAVTEPQWFADMTRIGLCTGARIDSIRHLDVENIGFTMGIINFKKSKTGSYTVPLHPELRAYLEKRLSNRSTGPLLDQEVLDKSDSYLSTMFTAIAQRKCGFHANFHMFRHTLTSLMAKTGIEKRIAMLITNHSDASVHDGYTHVQAAELLPQLSRINFGL